MFLHVLLIAANTSGVFNFAAECGNYAVPAGSSYSYRSIVPVHPTLLLEVFKRNQTP